MLISQYQANVQAEDESRATYIHAHTHTLTHIISGVEVHDAVECLVSDMESSVDTHFVGVSVFVCLYSQGVETIDAGRVPGVRLCRHGIVR